MTRYNKIKVFTLLISLMVGGFIARSYLRGSDKPSIYEYNHERDKQAVVKIFQDDWYWLSNREWNPSITDFVLRSHSPNEYEPRYFGKMAIKVLKEKDSVLGFVTYYMLNFYEGKILFLAVNQQSRGKRYGELLLKQAVDDLFSQGASLVRLVTRTDNISAQKLYKRFGFVQVPPWEDEGFVHFVIRKK